MLTSRIRPRQLSSTLIRSGLRSPDQLLTGSDILTRHVGIPIFYVYPQGLDIDRMQRALREVLTHHRLMTGRMQRRPDGHDVLVGNDEGVSFQVWQCDSALPDYGPHHPMHRDVLRYVKPIFPWQVIHRQHPLIEFRVFKFACGGAMLAIHVVHTLVDASTMWNFLVDWSHLACGRDVAGPVFEREHLFQLMQTLIDCPDTRGVMHAPSLLTRAQVYPRMGWQALRNRPGVYRVSPQEIDRWRQALPPDTVGRDRLTVSDLVTTHALKLMSQVQGHDHDRTVGLVSDLRYRKALGLPPRMFGNALGQEAVDFSAVELQSQSEAELALKFRQPGATHNLDETKGYLGMLERRRRAGTLKQLVPSSVMRSVHGGFMQNNYNHLPIYQVDLGTGAPTWFNPMAVPFRMIKIVPGPEGDGHVDIHLTATAAELCPFEERYGVSVL